jgi:hypothetical protein
MCPPVLHQEYYSTDSPILQHIGKISAENSSKTCFFGEKYLLIGCYICIRSFYENKRTRGIFYFLLPVSAFCGGNLELVNTQEIGLDNIADIKISYSSENISLFMGTTDTLIIKEYMNEDNSGYYARITNSGNISENIRKINVRTNSGSIRIDWII